MRSLRRFLLATSLPTITVLALGAAWVGYDGSRHEADEVFDARLSQYAELIAQAHDRERLHGIVGSRTRVSTTSSSTEPDYQALETFQIWEGGEQVLRSGFAPAIHPDQIQAGFQNLTIDAEDWRVYARQPDDKTWVIVSESLRIRDELALAIAGAALLPIMIGVPVLGLLLWWVITLALRRVDRVARAVEIRTPRDLTPVPYANAPRELRGLLYAINGLLDRLRAAIEREKRFSADAAHELRTPITGALIHLDNARLAPEITPQTRESLASARHGLRRMSHVVEQLLRFSRAVNGDERLDYEEFDLSDLLEGVMAEHQSTIEMRDQHLTRHLQPASVYGHAPLLGIAFGNLLSNASQYTPEGGRIRVSCRVDGDQVEAWIEDSGPGMDDDLIAQATERFQRGGRSPHADAPEGCGLGLAIVQRICEQHDATLQLVRSPALGGLMATIRLDAVPTD